MTENLVGGQIITRRKSGATFKEIEELIDGVANNSIGDIVIVGGTRETVDHLPTTQIKEGAEKLLRKAKSVTPSCSSTRSAMRRMGTQREAPRMGPGWRPM